MSYPICRTLAVLYWHSCHLFPLLDILFRLSFLAVLSQLSRPGNHVLAVLSQLSCSSNLVFGSLGGNVLMLLLCPGLSSLFYPGSPVQAHPYKFTCPGCPVLVVLSQLLYPDCPSMVVPSQLPCPGCFVLAGMFWPSCPLFPFLAVLTRLSPLAALSFSACLVPGVLLYRS